MSSLIPDEYEENALVQRKENVKVLVHSRFSWFSVNNNEVAGHATKTRPSKTQHHAHRAWKKHPQLQPGGVIFHCLSISVCLLACTPFIRKNFSCFLFFQTRRCAFRFNSLSFPYAVASPTTPTWSPVVEESSARLAVCPLSLVGLYTSFTSQPTSCTPALAVLIWRLCSPTVAAAPHHTGAQSAKSRPGTIPGLADQT